MRGDLNVIEYLNKGLRSELTAMNQYWLHYRLLDNWGYKTRLPRSGMKNRSKRCSMPTNLSRALSFSMACRTAGA